MSSFTDQLIVSPLPDGKRWVVRRLFYYYIDEDTPSGDKVVVPIGFVTDFASVPRVFWKILPKWGKYGNAAVVHDYLYSKGNRSRKECDKIFLSGMKVLGVPTWKRYSMYYAVRMFGWICFGKEEPLLEIENDILHIPKIKIKK